jgi:hypothetical protein
MKSVSGSRSIVVPTTRAKEERAELQADEMSTLEGRGLEEPLDELPVREAVVHGQDMERRLGGHHRHGWQRQARGASSRTAKEGGCYELAAEAECRKVCSRGRKLKKAGGMCSWHERASFACFLKVKGVWVWLSSRIVYIYTHTHTHHILH